MQILRVTYSNFGGDNICAALREVGRNGHLQEVRFFGFVCCCGGIFFLSIDVWADGFGERKVDFSGNEIGVREAQEISHELQRLPSMKKAFFDFTGLNTASMLAFVNALPYLRMLSLKQSSTSLEEIVDIFHHVSSFSGLFIDKRPRILELTMPVVYEPGLLEGLQEQFSALGVVLDFEYSHSISCARFRAFEMWGVLFGNIAV
jgi:hypothetical protein